MLANNSPVNVYYFYIVRTLHATSLPPHTPHTPHTPPPDRV
nr:hypothetical protein [Okeania sp. SIO2F4]